MNNRIAQLAERRAALVNTAAMQRRELTEAFAPLHAPLMIAEKGLHALRYLAQHPVLMAGTMALAVVVRPRRWLFVLESGWLVWRMAVSARRSLKLNE